MVQHKTDSVVINLTVYMNKNEPRPGLLLQETVNSHFSTQGYRIKVLQEEGRFKTL